MLSRAKIGMYMVGNSETLCSSKTGRSLWVPLINYMKEYGFYMEGVPSYCQLHPKSIVSLTVTNTKAFRMQRPNGGCTEQCTSRLKCGHSCPQKCHVIDRDHEFIQCFQKCKRFCDGCSSEHLCNKLCWEKCGECTFPVNVILNCGHSQNTFCCLSKTPAKIRCKTLVSFEVPSCRHKVMLECGKTRSPKSFCPSECSVDLPCGHQCPGTCGKCSGSQNHSTCKIECNRTLFCGHRCTQPCHGTTSCKPCENICDIRCTHSHCPKECKEVCASCVEPCIWACKHQGKCVLPCGAPCSRLPCNLRCSKLLQCGHRCPTVCGEACPSVEFCQVCGSKKSAVVDYINMSTFADQDLSRDPIIALSCGHIFAISTLDGHMVITYTHLITKLLVISNLIFAFEGTGRSVSESFFRRNQSQMECHIVRS
jgi:hypothetical protein